MQIEQASNSHSVEAVREGLMLGTISLKRKQLYWDKMDPLYNIWNGSIYGISSLLGADYSQVKQLLSAWLIYGKFLCRLGAWIAGWCQSASVSIIQYGWTINQLAIGLSPSHLQGSITSGSSSSIKNRQYPNQSDICQMIPLPLVSVITHITNEVVQPLCKGVLVLKWCGEHKSRSTETAKVLLL